MPSKFKLGDYYKYMIADKTKHPHVISPISGARIPLYLGLGPEVPTGSFTCTGQDYVVENILEVGHRLNPFSCPLVMAVRV